jgi:hypothetical protein
MIFPKKDNAVQSEQWTVKLTQVGPVGDNTVVVSKSSTAIQSDTMHC